MMNNEYQEKISNIKDKLQASLRNKSTRLPKKNFLMKKKGITFAQPQKDGIHEVDTHDIYQDYTKTPEQIDSDSSFQLDDNNQKQKHYGEKQTIEKVLARLGLNTKTKNSNNQELQMVVNNIIENCIGTVDTQENLLTYEAAYGQLYNEKVKNRTTKSSIIVSELRDLEKINKLPDHKLWGVYKYIRLTMKKLSLLCECIVQHPIFQSLILIIIILNSIKMAFDDPLSTEEGSTTIEDIFIVLYTLEMTIKIFAFGFVLSPGSYLRDAWNIMDFVIVSTSLMPLVININFSVNSLRAIRVLRPLKTITKVKSLKMIVSTLFFSFSLVMDSLYILLFVMVVFSIAGTQLFSGILQNRCMEILTGNLTDIMCSTGSTCAGGLICAKGIESPNFSITNFDTFIWSMLSVFRTLTLEGWSDIMISIQHAYSPYAFIYSVLIVFFCQYVLLNMTLAILKFKYSQVKGNAIQQDDEEINEYEPQFLKKIGIFKNISKLACEPPLSRYLCDSKNFVGSTQFYDDSSEKKNYHSYDLTLSRLQNAKNDKRKTTNVRQQSNKIDIEELKNFGRTQEQKWDAKTLEFEMMGFDEDVNRQDIKNRQNSQKNIKEDPEEEMITEMSSSDNSQEEDEDNDSENSDSELSFQSRKYIENRVIEVQKKLGTSENKIAINNALRSNKILPEVPVANKVVVENEEVQELDNMLRLISQSPGSSLTNNKFTIHLPDVDLEKMEVDRLYSRFNDLGEYRIKRIQKQNELTYFRVKSNNAKNIPDLIKKKQQNLIQQIREQTELDLKELQLVNQLSKKQLKSRIKPQQVLNQQRLASSYDITRVIVSQKLKQIEKREEEILESANNLNFHVTYHKSDAHKDSKGLIKNPQQKDSLFRRNLDNQMKDLKLPEMIAERTGKNIKARRSFSIKKEANNTYLKLLQNHQMEQKIQLREDRILQIFFKKQLPARKKSKQNAQDENQEEKKSLIEQYKQIREDDIFVRQGRIHLNEPYQTRNDSPESLLDKINIKPEEFQIYMTGIFGVFNVMRKKVLLFVSRPVYDNSMLLIVLINTAIMSMNGLVDTDQSPYSDMNTIFTYVFAVDLFLKIFAYGIGFFTDIMNLFDTLVVGISMVELSFGSGGSNLSALRAVRILRAFRVLRITRLIRSLSYMRIVMSVVSSIITEFVYIFMLLALFMFIYTLLGMQIFGGQFLPESVTGVRQSFDSFFSAFFSVFQVLTVENWNDIQTMVLTSKTGTWSIVYLISWIFIGNWILLNLLQAILLDGFDQDSTIFNKSQDQQQEQIQEIPDPQENDDENDTDNVSITSGSGPLRTKTTYASLFIFFPNNIVRQLAIKISNSPFFQNFIIIMIALSSIKLVIDTYIQPGSQLESIADDLDLVFNFIFIFESLLKIIAQGLLIGENAYLKSSWSKLDFFIVCTAVIDIVLDVNLSILKLFRTLRPLRIISRNPDMKIIISSLGESMIGIFNVLIIIMCIFLMIGILGINLLGGKLNYCNPTNELNHANYGPYDVNKTACQTAGGVWTTQLINFDNIGNSFLSLYVFSTRQNWPFYALTFMDATQDGPVKDNSQLVFLIFSVVIVFVCSYFFMDLLVGVLFMNFHKAEQKIRPKTLTDKQINWKNLQKIIIQEDPCFDLFLQPSNKFSQFFYKIVNLKAFEIFITLCIVGNIVIMMIATNDQTSDTSNTLDRLNFAFSIVFMIEAFFKLCTFGKAYFISGWNIFDFFVVMASVLDIVLSYAGAKSQSSSALSILPQIARIFRVMRVTKLLRMFKRFKGLQKLIETFLFSLPALARGLSIVCLFLFIFSVLASFLFNGISGDYVGIFDDTKNFQNFHSSFETLFIMTTGQNWYFYMYQSIYEGYVICKDGVECTQWYFLLFWLIYVFFSQKVFMQLFVLIVLDQFEANYINQNNPLGIFAILEDDFRTKWIDMTSKYHSEKIQAKRLLDFLLILREPLGLGKNQLMVKYEQELRENDKITEEEVKSNLTELDVKLKKNGAKLINKIPIIKNRMYLGYHETFYHLAKLTIAGPFLDSAASNQKLELDQMHKVSEEALQKLKPQGNLYFYQEDGNENSEKNEILNPIELILFCQMIVKSWHNYSLKYHSEKKEQKARTDDNSLYNSLNNSCASDIEQAKLEKLENQRKFIQRKGLMERRESHQVKKERPNIPNVEEHYRNDRKKGKLKMTKNKTSMLRKASRDASVLNPKGGIEIRITENQD